MDRSKWIVLLILVLLLGGAVFTYNQRSDKDNFSQEDAVQTEQTDDQKNDGIMKDGKSTDQTTPTETANTEVMKAPTAGADIVNLKTLR